MTEVVVWGCCPRCKSEQVFEAEPGKWRLFIAHTDTRIYFCPMCGHRLSFGLHVPPPLLWPAHVDDPGGHG